MLTMTLGTRYRPAATAVAFARAGADVALGWFPGDPHDVGPVRKAVEAAGRRAMVHELDVSSTESVNSFAAAAVKAFGRIDVCVATAGRSALGLSDFARRFPERYFDAASAEQHAVTFAAGLATEGYKPILAMHSTSLQRAYDQLIHDVALQRLPVLFAIDRAGLVAIGKREIKGGDRSGDVEGDVVFFS